MRFARLLLCGATAGALALAGCSSTTGGDASAAGGAAPTKDSPAFTSMVKLVDSVTASSHDVKTTHATMTTTVNGTKFMTADGDFDLRPQHLALAMTEKMNLGALLGAAKSQGGGSAGAGTMPKSVTMQFVLKDKTFYIKLPPELATMSPKTAADKSKPWHKIDLSKALGSQLRKYTSMADQANPAKQLKKFKNSGTITRTASEQLDGQHVTHYWITVDRQKMLAQLPDGAAKHKLAGSDSNMPKKLPVQLWLNDKKLPLKVQTKLTMMGTPASVKVHYTDWGKPVHIEAPPAGKVGAAITPPSGGGH